MLSIYYCGGGCTLFIVGNNSPVSHHSFNLLYYTYESIGLTDMNCQSTELYQHVLESVGGPLTFITTFIRIKRNP